MEWILAIMCCMIGVLWRVDHTQLTERMKGMEQIINNLLDERWKHGTPDGADHRR